MFEGVDPKCVVVNRSNTRKEPPPCAPYPSVNGLPMPPLV
jgi:hypothetical protein